MKPPDLPRVAAQICRKYHVQTLDLFGSRATGVSRDESDFDFCVAFDELSPAEYARCFFGVLHELEDVLGRPVDLVTWRSIRKTGLRAAIQQHGVRIYEREYAGMPE